MAKFVLYGAPQGSVLGSIFLLIFISNLADVFLTLRQSYTLATLPCTLHMKILLMMFIKLTTPLTPSKNGVFVTN